MSTYVDVTAWYQVRVIRRTLALREFGDIAAHYVRRWGNKWLIMHANRDQYEILDDREVRRDLRDEGGVGHEMAEELDFDLDYLCPVPPHRAA